MIFDHLQIPALLFDIKGHSMLVVYKALQEWAFGATPPLFCTMPEGEYCEGIVDDPPALPVLSLSFLGEELSMQLQGKLEAEFKEAQRCDGSAEEELKLALEISKLIRQLGGVVTDADVQAMCEKAYLSNNPELAGEVLRDHLEEMQREPPEDEPCAAERTYKRLLVRGGWEPSSVDDFVAGRRPNPVRDPEDISGSLMTDKADPLPGIGDELARRRALKKLLQKEAPPGAAESIEVRLKNGGSYFSLEREYVEQRLRDKASIEVQEALCANFFSIKRGPSGQLRQWLGKLGLEAPQDPKQMVNVLYYARSIIEHRRENEKRIEQSLYDALSAL